MQRHTKQHFNKNNKTKNTCRKTEVILGHERKKKVQATFETMAAAQHCWSVTLSRCYVIFFTQALKKIKKRIKKNKQTSLYLVKYTFRGST